MKRILAPTGKRRRLAQVGTIFTAIALLALILVPSAQAVLPGSPSKFESGNDPTLGLGNMIVDNLPVPPATPHADWVTVATTATNTPYVHLTDAAAVNSDDSFTPGQKQDTTCPTIEGHKNPPKDDFTDVASYTEQATNGDVYLYGATIRYTANGNASENIELKQSSTPCTLNGSLTARSAGDKLLAIDYLGGGKAVQFHVLTWVTSGACNVSNDIAPCWGATVLTLDPTKAEGGVNTTAIPGNAANNPINGKALVAGQFAEFGVNLTASGIIQAGSCTAFAQTVWESRSSGSSFVSSTKDITIEDKTISNCASVSVIKLGSDGGSQAGAVFTLYPGSNTSGTAIGSCTVAADGTCSDASFIGLNPGTYTFDESNTPAGYTKDASLPFTFTLAANEQKVLTFTDVLQTGAITIAKTAKHAGPNGSANLVAGFTVTDSALATHSVSTDATGSGCVDGLPPGSATVSETSPPTGYSAGADQTVTVVGGTTCTNADGVVASFENIPLTNITVSVDSQVVGGTSSTITCGSEPTVTTDDNGDGSLTVNDLEPNTPDGIVCTIVIDP